MEIHLFPEILRFAEKIGDGAVEVGVGVRRMKIDVEVIKFKQNEKNVKLKKLSFFILTMITISSCAYPRFISEALDTNKLKLNPESINGIYQNFSNDSNENLVESFWEHLKPFSLKEKDRIELNALDENAQLKINLIDHKRIQFELVQNDSITDVRKFKYYKENGQLILKRNSKLQGVPLVFYRHRNEKTVIGLTKDNDLIATFSGQYSGGILIIIFGDSVSRECVFERIE